jgi:hypothetical protein
MADSDNYDKIVAELRRLASPMSVGNGYVDIFINGINRRVWGTAADALEEMRKLTRGKDSR